MAQDSKIEWTKHTANLWWGCTEVHAGCDNCSASALSNRWGNDLWGADKPRKRIAPTFDNLAKDQRMAQKAGNVDRVFVGSMMDIFEKPMPMIDSKGAPSGFDTGQIRERFFNLISGGNYPNLDFLLLTKRPSNIHKYIPLSWKHYVPDNVMFGCSVVNPGTLFLVDQLCHSTPLGARRFLSIEPQLEYIPEIDLTSIHWVICGGESGPKKRPFNADWGRRLRDICKEQNVPFFFKQVDKVQDIPADLLIRQFPTQPAIGV